MAGYTWDSTIARYRDLRGRFVRETTVLQYVDRGIANAQSIGQHIGTLAGEGTLSPSAFNAVMRRELKAEYIRQYVLQRGGRAAMESSDWGRIGGMLREQYRYLDQFTADIAAGNVSPAQARIRTGMYFKSAREAAERARRVAKEGAEYNEVRWVLQPGENCPDCQAWARLGWQPIEPWPYGANCVPGSGCTVCLTNCNCILQWQK